VDEFGLIDRFFAGLAPAGKGIDLGVGDDAALLQPPPGRRLAMTLDTLVAGCHFLPDADPEGLGHKALAVNLSDLAAMGAEPAWGLLALTLPRIDEAWLTAFAAGLGALARRHGVALVGGDTCRGPLALALQLTGFVDPGRALRRDGAHPGDLIFVTGTLGDAALALAGIQAGRRVSAFLRMRLERPEPRVAEGRALAGIASACIDLSDGLASDLGHLCEASGCGARVEAARVPLSPAARRYWDGDWAPILAGGDDYELCFTVPPERLDALAASGVAYTRIGKMVDGSGVTFLDERGQPLPPMSGYDHFS